MKVKLASRLSAGHTYSVFKKGVVPDWEDKANVQGGRWMIYFDKNQRRGMLDDRWMEALVICNCLTARLARKSLENNIYQEGG